MIQVEELYGPGAKYADHQVGDVVSWSDRHAIDGISSGEIVHIAEQGGVIVYVVSPNTETFPLELSPAEILSRVGE